MELKLLITILISLSGFSQTSKKVTVYDKETVKHGEFIKFYVAPSAVYLDYSTPKKLFESAKKSKKRAGSSSTPVGHGMFEFNCTDLKGIRRSFYSSFNGTGWSRRAFWKIYVQKKGFGVLTEDFRGGYFTSSLETKKFLYGFRGRTEENLEGKKVVLQPAYIQLNVNPEACSKGYEFYRFFSKNRKLFGFSVDPHEEYITKRNTVEKQVVVGGCTPFLTGLMKAVGFWNDTMEKEFMRHLEIGENWIGGRNEITGKKRKVSIRKDLKKAKSSQWLRPGELSRTVSFADPEKIWDFIDAAHGCLVDSNKKRNNDCSQKANDWVLQNKFRPSIYNLTSRKATYVGIELDL